MMDSMRGLLSGSDERTEGAIEAPPAIGVDERRMQVRAYNFWAGMLGDRAYPSVEDLDVENLDDFGPHAVLLDFTAGIEDPAIVFLGDRLRAETDHADDAHYISQVPSRSVLSRLTDHYLQIIANRAPIGFEAEFVNERDVTIMYRGILLPFSSDDDTIDFIMGVINWKEAVVSPQADELVLEVEQALRVPPAAQLSASVPVWADGPDSEHLDDPAEEDLAAEPGFRALEGAAPHAPAAPPVFAPDPDDEVAAETAELDDTAELADWLALARETAAQAQSADSRSRSALYAAVGRAWDFAIAADAHPQDFAELLEDAGLKAQERAPMTPLVKLVFGAGYDKTRLAEYACVLGHAKDSGIARGALPAYLEAYSGGLKALLRDERARKRPERVKPAPVDAAVQLESLRALPPAIMLPIAGEQEFVVLVARRVDADHVGLVASLDADNPAWTKLLANAQPLG
jgi:hypothetical protein